MQADRGIACSVTAKAGYPMNTAPLGIDRIGVPFLTGIIQTTLNEHLLVRYGSVIEDLCWRSKFASIFESQGR
jgi:amidase